MTQKQFDREIAKLLRRLLALRAGKRGELPFKRVLVKSYTVKQHVVKEHYRNIAGKRS